MAEGLTTSQAQNKPMLSIMSMPGEIIQNIVNHLLRDCEDRLVVNVYQPAMVVNTTREFVHFPKRVKKLVLVSKEFSRMVKPAVWCHLSNNVRIWDNCWLPRPLRSDEDEDEDRRLYEKALTLLSFLLDHGWVEQTKPIVRKPPISQPTFDAEGRDSLDGTALEVTQTRLSPTLRCGQLLFQWMHGIIPT